jgi:hypothetical protein
VDSPTSHFAVVDPAVDRGVPLDGQFRVNGELNVFSFDSSRSLLVGEWDTTASNFQMAVQLIAKSESGEEVTLQGTIGGRMLNRSPVPVPGAAQTVECAAPAGTTAILDASGSFDLDGNLSAHEWFGPIEASLPLDEGRAFARSATATTPPLPLGVHNFRLRVTDAWGWNDSELTSVSVVDSQGPTINTTQQEDCLWPPNHRLVQYTLGQDVLATADDQCTGNASSTVRVAKITSNQPGMPGDDPQFAFNANSFCLRAERDGNAGDRIYTVTLAAADPTGNETTKDITIVVPHDQRPPGRCLHSHTARECELPQQNPRLVVTPPRALATGVAERPPSAGSTMNCSYSPRGNAGTRSAGTLLFCLAACLWATRRRRLSQLLLMGLLCASAGCSSSGPSSNGTAVLSVKVADRAAISVMGDPAAFPQAGAYTFLVADQKGTVYLSIPRSMTGAKASCPIGTTAGTATLWAKESTDPTPITATSGELFIDELSSTDAGRFRIRIGTATKQADAVLPALKVDGYFDGSWDQMR